MRAVSVLSNQLPGYQSPQGQAVWMLGFFGLTLVLLLVAETPAGPVAGALAALVSSSATFVFLPLSLKNLGFIK